MKSRFRSWLIVSSGLLLLGLPRAVRAQYTVLHNFVGGSADGARPWFGASLVANGSTLYGMTTAGGSANEGTLFAIDTGGSGFQIRHSFAGYTLLNTAGSKDDGAVPYGTPVLLGSVLYGMTQQGGSNAVGTIFKMNTDGNGFQVLHSFAGSGGQDGSMPDGSLVSDGTAIYGMTLNGGSNSDGGVIFRINTDGSGYQVLHFFGSIADDGGSPFGSLVLDGATLYGMTRNGGTLSEGTIFEINTNGTEYQVIRNFSGTLTDGGHPNGSLIASGSMLYGLTDGGGSNGYGAVFSIATNGTGFQILHSFDSSAYGLQGDLTRAGSKLFGMTTGGDVSAAGGAVFQLNADGSGFQILHGLNGSSDGSTPLGSLLLVDGHVYGMTSILGSSSGGTIFSLPVTVPSAGLWSNATDLGAGWVHLDWFGDFATNSTPWIYHNHHGWLYPVGTDPASLWFWDLSKQTWWWTSSNPGVYPFLWRDDGANSTWLWYYTDTSSPRWLHNYRTGLDESWP